MSKPKALILDSEERVVRVIGKADVLGGFGVPNSLFVPSMLPNFPAEFFAQVSPLIDDRSRKFDDTPMLRATALI